MINTKRVPISKELRRRVFERDHYTCRYCGSKNGPFQADHVYPVIKGGETTINNLVTACRTCNNKKGGKVGVWPWPFGAKAIIRKVIVPGPQWNLGVIFLLLAAPIITVSTLVMQGYLSPGCVGAPGVLMLLFAVFLIRRGV